MAAADQANQAAAAVLSAQRQRASMAAQAAASARSLDMARMRAERDRLAAAAERMAAQRAVDAVSTNIAPTRPFRPTYKGKAITQEAEVGSIRASVMDANSVEEALTRFREGPKKGVREAAVEAGIRQAFTRDGRVKSSFADWRLDEEGRLSQAWRDRIATEERYRESARIKDNQDGWGRFANIGARALNQFFDSSSSIGYHGLKFATDASASLRDAVIGDTAVGKAFSILRPAENPFAGANALDIIAANDTAKAEVANRDGQMGLRGAAGLNHPAFYPDGILGKVFGAMDLTGSLMADPLNVVGAGALTKGLSKASDVAGLTGAVGRFGDTAVGHGLRTGFVPFTRTRDLARQATGDVFGRANDLVDGAKNTVARSLGRTRNALDDLERSTERVTTAFGKGGVPADLQEQVYKAREAGDLDGLITALDGPAREYALEVQRRAEAAYDMLRAAGVAASDLRDRGSYLQRFYTPEVREMLGLPKPGEVRPYARAKEGGSKTGTQQSRTFIPDAQSDELAEAFGVDRALVMDPLSVSGVMYQRAAQVLSHKRIVDDMEEALGRVGIDPETAIWHAPSEGPRVSAASKARYDQELDSALSAGRTPEEARDQAIRASNRVKRKDVQHPEGFTKVAPGVYMDGQLAQDLVNLQRAGANNKLVRGLDKFMGALRGATLLNPANAPGYIIRNSYSAQIMAWLRGGVNPLSKEYVSEGMRLRKLHVAVDEAAGRGDDAIRASLSRQGMSAEDIDTTMLLRDAGVYNPSRGTYEDVYEDLSGRKSRDITNLPGFKQARQANTYAEEVPRGVMYRKLRKDGLSHEKALAKTQDTLIRYGAEGFTEFERNYLKRATLFYSWAARAPKQVVQGVVDNPRVVAALDKTGFGFPDEENQFGTPLGFFADTPLLVPGATGQTLAELASGGVVRQLNPLLQMVLDPRARGNNVGEAVRNLLPPLDSVLRDVEQVRDGEGGQVLAALVGAKFGKDYGAAQSVGPDTDWSKEEAASLDIELRRLGLPADGSREDKIARLQEAGGVGAPYQPTRGLLSDVARNLNLTSDEIGRLGDQELAAMVEQGNVLPVLPRESDINPLGKLYDIKGWSDWSFEEKLAFALTTPEGKKLLTSMQVPGYLEARESQSFFEKAMERESLRGLLSAGG